MRAILASVMAALLLVAPACIGSAAAEDENKPEAPRDCILGGAAWVTCGLPSVGTGSLADKIAKWPLPKPEDREVFAGGNLPKPSFFEWHGPYSSSAPDYLTRHRAQF